MAKKKIAIGMCLFCNEKKELQRSHVINKSIFSKLLKNCPETNAARVISLKSPIIKNSNDNWTDRLLCRDCESYFNTHFDDYGLHALRGEIIGVKITRTKDKVCYFNVDADKIFLYILSLYWRGVVSKHPSYDTIISNEAILSYIKNALKCRNSDLEYINVKISIIYDGLGVVDSEVVKHMMVSPFSRLYETNLLFSFCFLMEGFFIEIIFGKLPYKMKKKGSWLNPKLKFLKCDLINLHDITELHKIFAQMFISKKYMEDNNIELK